MLTESTIMPQHPFEIEGEGDTVDVLFYEDVIELPLKEEQEKPSYQYQLYRLEGIANRPGLEVSIMEKLESWMELAKLKEFERSSSQELTVDEKIAQQDAVIEDIMFNIIPSLTGI